MSVGVYFVSDRIDYMGIDCVLGLRVVKVNRLSVRLVD